MFRADVPSTAVADLLHVWPLSASLVDMFVCAYSRWTRMGTASWTLASLEMPWLSCRCANACSLAATCTVQYLCQVKLVVVLFPLLLWLNHDACLHLPEESCEGLCSHLCMLPS